MQIYINNLVAGQMLFRSQYENGDAVYRVGFNEINNSVIVITHISLFSYSYCSWKGKRFKHKVTVSHGSCVESPCRMAISFTKIWAATMTLKEESGSLLWLLERNGVEEKYLTIIVKRIYHSSELRPVPYNWRTMCIVPLHSMLYWEKLCLIFRVMENGRFCKAE